MYKLLPKLQFSHFGHILEQYCIAMNDHNLYGGVHYYWQVDQYSYAWVFISLSGTFTFGVYYHLNPYNNAISCINDNKMSNLC